MVDKIEIGTKTVHINKTQQVSLQITLRRVEEGAPFWQMWGWDSHLTPNGPLAVDYKPDLGFHTENTWELQGKNLVSMSKNWRDL